MSTRGSHVYTARELAFMWVAWLRMDRTYVQVYTLEIEIIRAERAYEKEMG